MHAAAAHSPSPHLCGIGLPPDALQALAGRWRMRALDVTDGVGEMPAPAVFILASADEVGVRRALDARATAIVENAVARCCVVESGPAGEAVRIFLGTGAAFALGIAGLICDSLVRRNAIPENRRPDVEAALHEAVTNAAIHGNLGIRNGPADAAEFQRFFDLVRERLADREMAARCIRIEARWNAEQLELSVADEGDGYDADALQPADPTAASGRGLQIMRGLADAVVIGDGGRRLELRFRT